MKWARCKVCGRKICVNNNDAHEIRPHRIRGVAVCPWCSEEAVDLYLIVKGLAKLAQAGHLERKSKLEELANAARERLGA